MKFRIYTRIILSIGPLLFTSGCGNFELLEPRPDISRFYLLESDLGGIEAIAGSTNDTQIMIGPSSVAKYLEQPQIVTLADSNVIQYSDQNRWGEPLEEGINRLLVENLGRSLKTSHIGAMPMLESFDYDYKIGYHVYKLGGQLGQRVDMHITWWILDQKNNQDIFENSLYTQPITPTGDPYQDYVRAIQNLIATWSDDIAATIER